MAAPFKRTIVWQDANGTFNLRTLTTQAGAPLIQAALVAKSNAVVIEWWEQADNLVSATPTAASYPSVTNVAYLLFEDGAGNAARLALPSPQAGIFLPDGVTVDPAQIAGIISAAQAEVVTVPGNLVTVFRGGTLGRGTSSQ